MDICEGESCEQVPAAVNIYAAYNEATRVAGMPQLNRYPAPMFKSCLMHIGELINSDHKKPGDTGLWVIEVIK